MKDFLTFCSIFFSFLPSIPLFLGQCFFCFTSRSTRVFSDQYLTVGDLIFTTLLINTYQWEIALLYLVQHDKALWFASAYMFKDLSLWWNAFDQLSSVWIPKDHIKSAWTITPSPILLVIHTGKRTQIRRVRERASKRLGLSLCFEVADWIKDGEWQEFMQNGFDSRDKPEHFAHNTQNSNGAIKLYMYVCMCVCNGSYMMNAHEYENNFHFKNQ